MSKSNEATFIAQNLIEVYELLQNAKLMKEIST